MMDEGQQPIGNTVPMCPREAQFGSDLDEDPGAASLSSSCVGDGQHYR